MWKKPSVCPSLSSTYLCAVDPGASNVKEQCTSVLDHIFAPTMRLQWLQDFSCSFSHLFLEVSFLCGSVSLGLKIFSSFAAGKCSQRRLILGHPPPCSLFLFFPPRNYKAVCQELQDESRPDTTRFKAPENIDLIAVNLSKYNFFCELKPWRNKTCRGGKCIEANPGQDISVSEPIYCKCLIKLIKINYMPCGKIMLIPLILWNCITISWKRTTMLLFNPT